MLRLNSFDNPHSQCIDLFEDRQAGPEDPRLVLTINTMADWNRHAPADLTCPDWAEVVVKLDPSNADECVIVYDVIINVHSLNPEAITRALKIFNLATEIEVSHFQIGAGPEMAVGA